MSAIDDKYNQLGGPSGWLGAPFDAGAGSGEGPSGNGGRERDFVNGTIVWTQQTGAHEVHGNIRLKWAQLGGSRGFLGFPVTDETGTPDGVGRYNHFQGGSIYWTPQTGAHEVHGGIREKWASLGWERSSLRYPMSDEQASNVPGGRLSQFQGGSIYWTPNGATEVRPSTKIDDN